jgi:hypothetical protein
MENSSIKEQIAAQNIISQISSNPAPPSPAPAASGGTCPQCGLMHPPVQPGEKCPMAPIVTQNDTVVDPTNFLTKMKLIISNQLEQKGVKDPEKFFQHLTVELLKARENFKE